MLFTFDSNKENTDANKMHYYREFVNCTAANYEKTDFLVVKNIKIFLYDEGYFDGPINDNFDSKLENSIRDFQKAMGIRIDGIIGPTTYKTMQKYDSCTKKSDTNFISCFNGAYLAYRACTSPYGSFTLEIPTTTTTTVPVATPVSEDTTNKQDCEDGGQLWNADSGELWRAEGDSLIYTNCDEFTVLKNTGYDFTEKPIPGVTPGVSGGGGGGDSSGGLSISNLGSTISIAENQKSVVTVAATGSGTLSYALSGTDSHLMSINSSGVVTLNSNADYEQKTSYSATVTVTDSTGSTTGTLSVSVTDTTEYATVKVVTWYDGDTLSNATDRITVDGNLVCGICTVSDLTTQWETTQIWQNKRFSNSQINLRAEMVTPQEWTSLTSAQANGIALNSYDPHDVFTGNEQINKYAIRNGIHHSHLVNTWAAANGNSCVAYMNNPETYDMRRHFMSYGIIKGFNCFSHEFGHSLGIAHAVNQASQASTYEAGTYDYGYYDSVNNIGTVMSYSGLFCGLYSNPDIKCPNQAERDAAETAGTYDSSNTDIDKQIDGTWGSIPAGKENEADAARFMNEYLVVYERSYPATNYGVTVGSEYVSTSSLFPLFDGSNASYSYTEGLTKYPNDLTLTMYSELGTNQTESSVTYSNLTWCDVQNCDIIYHPIEWSSKTGYNAQLGFQFYLNQGNLYIRRSKPAGAKFMTNKWANHVEYLTPCLQLNKYMRAGDYLETDCTTEREDAFGNQTDVPNWNFSNVVGKELVVTPYGAYDAFKIITSHALWDDDAADDYDIADFDFQTLIFWVEPDVGLVMFEDGEKRRWKLTAMDTDGDGTDNKTDTDDDNDGVLDTADALPLDPNSSTDDNNDGRADEDE